MHKNGRTYRQRRGATFKRGRGARKKWQSLAVLYIRNKKKYDTPPREKRGEKEKKNILNRKRFFGRFFRTNGIVENRVS